MFENPNGLIQQIFDDFSVNGEEIPVSFLRFNGDPKTVPNAYVTYQQTDSLEPLNGDDTLLNYVDFYDFDIFSKGNYIPIVEAIKEKLTANGFMWQPTRSSGDMYEDDTGYYHKTLSFSIERSTNNG